jgi:hypothetical protein
VTHRSYVEKGTDAHDDRSPTDTGDVAHHAVDLGVARRRRQPACAGMEQADAQGQAHGRGLCKMSIVLL